MDGKTPAPVGMNPWWKRESTWTGIAKIALDLSALAAGIAAFADPAAPDGRWLVAAAVLKTVGSVSGQISTFFVRLAVTNVATKVNENETSN